MLQFFKLLIASSTAYFVYQTNHLLRFLADFLASDTLDSLSNRYSAWYNMYLISKVINFSDTGKKNRSVIITRQETIDSMIIAELDYHGLTSVELELYLIKSLTVIAGINLDSIQVSNISKGHAKLIFSMLR